MNFVDPIRRLQAWRRGRPLPRYSTKHVAIATPENALGLAFVRMGGETLPWGVQVCSPGEDPVTEYVPDPRNRESVAAMMEEVASTLLAHFRHPWFDEAEEPSGLRQLWLPDRSHLDMLHHLAYVYTFAQRGTEDRILWLNALGRLCGWLFRESQRPGQMTVVVAADVLRGAYTFPSDPTRESHLGFLVGWLNAGGSRERRLEAATTAERLTIGTSLDPDLERHSLSGILRKWNAVREHGDVEVESWASSQIGNVLTGELQRRTDLMYDAIAAYTEDPRPINPGLAVLVSNSLEQCEWQFRSREASILSENKGDDPGEDTVNGYAASPETDWQPTTAAAQFHRNQGYESQRYAVLIQHDADMQHEAVQLGAALQGKITAVERKQEGDRKVLSWVVRCHTPAALAVREGDGLCVVGLPKRTVRVDAIVPVATDVQDVYVTITGLPTRPRGDATVLPASSVELIGQRVVLVPQDRFKFHERKSGFVYRWYGAGSWLTHSMDTTPAVVSAAEEVN